MAVVAAVAGALWSAYIGAGMVVGLVTGAGGGTVANYLIGVVMAVPALAGLGLGIYIAASSWRR